jgi:NAD(P)-dependent dehydrogenase (short-subunit alcohol dehydrogenase family)
MAWKIERSAAALYEIGEFSSLGSSRVYGKTKLMDIMFSMEMARQLSGTGGTANCIDPGFNVTGLGRELSFAAPLEKILNWLKIGSPQRGADILIKLAAVRTFSKYQADIFRSKTPGR